MTFDLLPGVTPWLALFFTVATVGALTSITVLVWFVTDNHRERVTRHESIPVYYRHLLVGH
jgi:hypothetical protein